MSKAVRGTREWLHGLGWKPGDGKGGIVSVTAEQDFDNGGGKASVGPAPADGSPAERIRYPIGTPPPVVNSRPQIRIPKRRIPNRTENLYQGEARRRWPECELRYEAFAFILPSGCRYVPDWTVWRGAELVAVVEVKGGYLHPNSTRSIHAWKEAAAAWPAVRFVFAQWKDGTWNETEVTPIL